MPNIASKRNSRNINHIMSLPKISSPTQQPKISQNLEKLRTPISRNFGYTTMKQSLQTLPHNSNKFQNSDMENKIATSPPSSIFEQYKAKLKLHHLKSKKSQWPSLRKSTHTSVFPAKDLQKGKFDKRSSSLGRYENNKILFVIF